MKIQKIEITFPVEVEPPEGFYQTLDSLVGMICKKYQAENPDRVMWPAGSGSKPLFNWMTVSDDEPLPFDDSVYVLECTEREDYHGNNPHNPRAAELQKAAISWTEASDRADKAEAALSNHLATHLCLSKHGADEPEPPEDFSTVIAIRARYYRATKTMPAYWNTSWMPRHNEVLAYDKLLMEDE